MGLEKVKTIRVRPYAKAQYSFNPFPKFIKVKHVAEFEIPKVNRPKRRRLNNTKYFFTRFSFAMVTTWSKVRSAFSNSVSTFF